MGPTADAYVEAAEKSTGSFDEMMFELSGTKVSEIADIKAARREATREQWKAHDEHESVKKELIDESLLVTAHPEPYPEGWHTEPSVQFEIYTGIDPRRFDDKVVV